MGERQGAVATQQRQEFAQRRPVAVEEAAVATARARATHVSLQENDPGRTLAFLQRERRPQPGVTAAHDANVGADVTLERSRRLICARFVQPPRRKLGADGQGVAADFSRRIWTSTFVTMALTAKRKITLPITLTCGGAPMRAA